MKKMQGCTCTATDKPSIRREAKNCLLMFVGKNFVRVPHNAAITAALPPSSSNPKKQHHETKPPALFGPATGLSMDAFWW
jgi:hypothetical protein